MATSNQIRVVAIELDENLTALKTAVDAIDTVVSAWVLNDIDGSLPTDVAVKAQLAAYNAIAKASMSISDAIAAVNEAV